MVVRARRQPRSQTTQQLRANRIVRGRLEHAGIERPGSSSARAVLLVQERRGSLAVAGAVLEAAGYVVSYARTIEQAVAATSRFDVAILDLVLYDRSGVDVLAEFHRTRPQTRTIVLIEHGTRASAAAAFRAGASAELVAPFQAVEMLEIVDRAVEDSVAARERADLTANAAALERFVGFGRAAAALVHDIANPLSVALGSLEYAHDALATADIDAEVRSAIEDGRAAAERAVAIVGAAGQRLRSDHERETHSIADIVRDATAPLGEKVSKEVRIDFERARGALVRSDRASLARAVMNVIANAVAAIEHGVASCVATDRASRTGQRVARRAGVDRGLRLRDDKRGRTLRLASPSSLMASPARLAIQRAE